MEKNWRIIFKSSGDLNAIRKLAVDNFWDLDALVRADPQNQVPYELHFRADDDSFKVVYVEDPISECNYVIVSGEGAEKARSLIMEKTDFWKPEDMFSDWSKAPHDTARILAILRIGVGAPYEYEERFSEKLDEGLADADEAIREAALAAIGYRDWPQFDKALQDVADNDLDERCRNRAAYMLEVRAGERALSLK